MVANLLICLIFKISITGCHFQAPSFPVDSICTVLYKVPGRLLYTSLRHSQSTSFTVSHSTSPDRTTLPAQRFRSSGLLCRWSDGLDLLTGHGQSPWPGAQQQQLQTVAENEHISSLPLCTHSAVEIFHNSVLYKSIINIDILCTTLVHSGMHTHIWPILTDECCYRFRFNFYVFYTFFQFASQFFLCVCLVLSLGFVLSIICLEKSSLEVTLLCK